MMNINQIEVYDCANQLIPVTTGEVYPLHNNLNGKFLYDGDITTHAHTNDNDLFSYFVIKLAVPVSRISKVFIANREVAQNRQVGARVLLLSGYTPRSHGDTPESFLNKQVIRQITIPISSVDDGYDFEFDCDTCSEPLDVIEMIVTSEPTPDRTLPEPTLPDVCPTIHSVLIIKKRSDSKMSGSTINLGEIEIYDENDKLIHVAKGSVYPTYGGYGVGNLYDMDRTTFAHTTDSLDFSYINLVLPASISRISRVFVLNRLGGTDARAVGIRVMLLSSYMVASSSDSYNTFIQKQSVLKSTAPIKGVAEAYEFKFKNTDTQCNEPSGVFEMKEQECDPITHVLLYKPGLMEVDKLDAYSEWRTQVVPVAERFASSQRTFSYVALKLATPTRYFKDVAVTPFPRRAYEVVGARVLLLSKFTPRTSATQTAASFLASLTIRTETPTITQAHSKYTFRFAVAPLASDGCMTHAQTIVADGTNELEIIDTESLTYPVNKPTQTQLASQRFKAKTVYTVPGSIRASKSIGMCSRGDYIITMTDERQSDGSFLPFVLKVNTVTGVTDKQVLDRDYRSVSEGHHSWIVGIDRANYIHIIGDMHNGKERKGTKWEGNSIMYWRSTSPMGLQFEFLGKTGGRTIELNQATYYNFYYSRDGQLWLSTRIRQSVSSRGSYFSCMGLYKYHEDTLTWQTIGGYAPVTDGSTKIFFGSPDGGQSNQDVNTPGTWYQNGKASLFFDANGIIHWVYVSNDDNLYYNNIIIYAKSRDDGETWEWYDGTPIAALPITTDKGVNPGEIVDESPIGDNGRLHDACGILADLDGRVVIFARPLPVSSSVQWNPNSSGLWMYIREPGSSKWTRSRSNHAAYYIFPTGYMAANGVVTYDDKLTNPGSDSPRKPPVEILRTTDVRTYESSANPATPVALWSAGLSNLTLDGSEWYNPAYSNRIRFTADKGSTTKDLVIIEYTLE